MRNSSDVYWSTSLPKDHHALQTLDAYCLEWGGLSRAEATRRLLIEWDKLRRGESTSAWVPQNPFQQGSSGTHQRMQQASEAVNKPMMLNSTAKVASQSLDD